MACAEGAGINDGGQDAQGLIWGETVLRWDCGRGEFTPSGRRERKEVWESVRGLLARSRRSVEYVCGWDGEGVTSITAESGSVTEDEVVCPSGLSASLQSLRWRY